MLSRHSTRTLITALVVSSFAAAGCGKKPPPVSTTITSAPEAKVKAPLTILVSADTNPDATGRPSPVVVRVYQLKAEAAFNGADFFALFDDDQKILGSEMISRDEFVLNPSEQRRIEVTVSGETRWLGAVAAFRDIRNAQWRVLMPASRRSLILAVERARIVLSLAAAN